MSSISSLSMFISSVSLMQSSETELQKLAQQNATGEQSVSLQGYGASAPLILNLESAIQQAQSWSSGATQVGTYLTGYNTALGQLGKDATSLQTTLNEIGTSDTQSVQGLQTLIQGLETDVGATLNTQVGNRFIFAGSRYGTAPVVDLTTLATPATPTAITLASGSTTPPTIPDYDTDYASTTPAGVVASGTPYYGQQQINLSATETVSYGVSSDDPAIQQLVYALKQAEAGAGSTNQATANQFFANARSAVTAALNGIATLTEQNGDVQSQVNDAQTAQTQSVATMQNQLGDLTQVDAATVAAQLSALENQLSGTYKATSTVLGLSLLNDI